MAKAAQRKKKRHVPSLTDVWAAIAEQKRNREQDGPQTQEEAPKAKHRRQENGTEMTTEGSADVRGKQEGSNWTETATLPTKGAKATEKGKSFQYVCPHCDQSVTSTTRTGQVDLRGTCGHRFRVREGRLCAKAYDYVCPACNGHVASNVATGHIDHRRVCLWEQFFCEGWCCEREMVWFTGAHFATEM
jgi:hypothetical protein